MTMAGAPAGGLFQRFPATFSGPLSVNNLLPECRRQAGSTGAILRRKLIEMNWSGIRHNAGIDVDRFRSSYRADFR
jgi:hypothetical protein